MPNRRRGEIAAVVDGRAVVLCLTLGALCELEAAFGVDDLVALADRFAEGRLAARDVLRIFACGLRGGGSTMTDAEVAAARIDGGLVGAATAVADLLAVTFGVDTPPAGEARGTDRPPAERVVVDRPPAEGLFADRPPAVPGGGADAFPWDDLMRLGFGRWGLAPAAFWSMTPREVAAVLRGPVSAVVDRAGLEALMRRFPDSVAGPG